MKKPRPVRSGFIACRDSSRLVVDRNRPAVKRASSFIPGVVDFQRPISEAGATVEVGNDVVTREIEQLNRRSCERFAC